MQVQKQLWGPGCWHVLLWLLQGLPTGMHMVVRLVMGGWAQGLQSDSWKISPKSVCGSGSQSWGPRLVSYTCTSTEPELAARVGSRLQRGKRLECVGESREGFRQVASANKNICGSGQNLGKIIRGPTEALWALGFFNDKNCWGSLQSSH